MFWRTREDVKKELQLLSSMSSKLDHLIEIMAEKEVKKKEVRNFTLAQYDFDPKHVNDFTCDQCDFTTNHVSGVARHKRMKHKHENMERKQPATS